MNSVLLQPAAGQMSPFGGKLQFWSPSAPSVAPGDQWFLTASGMVPGLVVWASIPFASSQDMAVIGTVNPDGTFSAEGLTAEPGNINGLRLARNWGNPFGQFVCQFVAAVPPPPPPTPVPGIELLISTVLAHRAAGAQPLVTVSNFIGAPGGLPGLTYTQVVGGNYIPDIPVPFVMALDDPTSAGLAALLGATVVKALPPDIPASAVSGPQPLVNWLHMPKDWLGIPNASCCAGFLAQELLVNYLDGPSLLGIITSMFSGG